MPLLCLLKVPSGARALSVDRAWERGWGGDTILEEAEPESASWALRPGAGVSPPGAGEPLLTLSVCLLAAASPSVMADGDLGGGQIQRVTGCRY